MSLPDAWIEKIFAKLTLVYGHQFLSRWDGLPLDTVKADWAHELSRFQQNPDGIAFGLQNLPADRPPTVIEFRAICNRRPVEAPVMLSGPPADPERVKREVSRLALDDKRPDPKDWARRILACHKQGDKLSSISVRFAREALGVKS